MGEVRAGWDKVLDRPVAVKVLRVDVASNPVVRRRFEAEAKAAARLVHPNIVQVFDSGEDHGVPFMVMEKLPGHSLRDEIRARRLSVTEAMDLANQVLAALDAAHAAGLVHRDIKPANILSSGGGHWKVADFGIAKSLQPSGDETITGMVLGTPAYLPPERLLGGAATPSGDLYALGVILYEALAGQKPYEAADPAGWVTAASTGPAPLRHVRPDVPAPLAAVVERSLSHDPGHRYSSAAEMATAVRAARSAGAEDPAGWLTVAPATPESPGLVGASQNGPGDTTVRNWGEGSILGGDTEVLLTRIPDARTGASARRRWLAGIGASIAALLAATIALATVWAPAKGHAPTTPTTVFVQVTTTTPPLTTVPVAKAPPPPGHGHPGGPKPGGGDQGDHGG